MKYRNIETIYLSEMKTILYEDVLKIIDKYVTIKKDEDEEEDTYELDSLLILKQIYCLFMGDIYLKYMSNMYNQNVVMWDISSFERFNEKVTHPFLDHVISSIMNKTICMRYYKFEPLRVEKMIANKMIKHIVREHTSTNTYMCMIKDDAYDDTEIYFRIETNNLNDEFKANINKVNFYSSMMCSIPGLYRKENILIKKIIPQTFERQQKPRSIYKNRQRHKKYQTSNDSNERLNDIKKSLPYQQLCLFN